MGKKIKQIQINHISARLEVSDGGLSAEEVKGQRRQERRDALLVMKVKGNHLSQSFGELCLHELHASIGALHVQTHKHTHKYN